MGRHEHLLNTPSHRVHANPANQTSAHPGNFSALSEYYRSAKTESPRAWHSVTPAACPSPTATGSLGHGLINLLLRTPRKTRLQTAAASASSWRIQIPPTAAGCCRKSQSSSSDWDRNQRCRQWVVNGDGKLGIDLKGGAIDFIYLIDKRGGVSLAAWMLCL